jgi:hypothetical protein
MYRVQWRKSVGIDLALEWSQADPLLGKAIRAAFDRIEMLLRDDPWAHGESRPRDRRIVFVPPVVVTYSIADDVREVSILDAS